MDETLLIQQCKKKDKKSQRLLFDHYAPKLLPVCMRYLRDFHEAEDAMLSGFQNFFQAINTFDYKGEGSIMAWLKKIVVNECLMALRKGNRMQIEREEQGIAVVIESGIWGELEAKIILKLIANLPDGYRTVFNLYAVEGYTHREIAVALNITEGTSKSQLSKARAILQTSIQKHNYYAGK